MSNGKPPTFRDLNKNGQMDPYEDPNASVDVRVEDLLRQMTIEEKAGLMFYPIAFIDAPPGIPADEAPDALIRDKHLTHITAFGDAEPAAIAEWHNQLQRWAESTRLGIPITVATDPRHAITSHEHAGFSQWPEPTGLAATRDVELVESFADIARQEYLAVGFRVALSPQADLATEPRWGRLNGTFGEDADVAAEMTAAYIRGFQGTALGRESVACMVKHFPGGGPQKDGEVSHFPYGREQVYPAGMFDEHLKPFEAAFEAGVAQVMPCYGMPVGTEHEAVGFGFNQGIVTGLLRERYGFDGVVCTDWGLITDDEIFGKVLPARAWGVEHLTIPERMRKVLDAGVDMFGGEACPEVIVEFVKSGAVSDARIDVSARRLLRDKFRLGLFDWPYVDPEEAEKLVGQRRFVEAGETAQRRSIVLLKNDQVDHGRMLPLPAGTKLWLEGIDAAAAATYGQVVSTLSEADVAILRLPTPFEPRDQYPLERFFRSGSLAFPEAEVRRILDICRQKPAIIDIALERPAVIPEIAAAATAVLGTFGASDAAVLDVIFGRFSPTGQLPFELPSSMAAVELQAPDAPHDSVDPVYPYGWGLAY
jgi:beta-glucosidase